MWLLKVLLVLLTYHFSLITSSAQTLYSQNMEAARLFLESGCLKKAQQHYMTAIEQAESTGEGNITDAQMGLVDALKFWQPVEAQRWANRCEQASRRDAITRRNLIIMNACISFTLGNTSLFDTHYQNYHSLLDANEGLPAKGLRAMEAMHQAMNHYYDEALNQLAQEDSILLLDRLDITACIYRMACDTTRLLATLQRQMEAKDSLMAALYDSNLSSAATTASMTRAQQKAEADSSTLLKVVLGLAALCLAMLIVWLRLRHKDRKALMRKNKQLTEALRMANETDEMKTEFVRRVSHEIRTPLNAIIGFNEILYNSGIELPAEERSDLVMRINDNMDAITKIVNEMLRLAETETEVKYECEDRVLCNDFFSGLLYSHEKDASAGVTLKYTTRVVNRDRVIINAEVVTDIMENLISNAIKFTSEGSIELFCHKEKGMLHLTVTDTGTGIPADKQDEVFEKFAKADAFKPGIGLGLTVSRNIARKMGGDLVLDKSYDKGARFILTLPLITD